VQQFGGSLAAPGWGDIGDWWRRIRSMPADVAQVRSLHRRFGFLDDLVPSVQQCAVRRASATIARMSDAQPLP
jgi:hypothetical protein